MSYLSITRFGDQEDAKRDVRQSAHVRTIDGERFAMVISMLAEKLEANTSVECVKHWWPLNRLLPTFSKGGLEPYNCRMRY